MTGIRKDMKTRLATLYGKRMLKKRFSIECVFHILKDCFKIDHTHAIDRMLTPAST